MSGKEELIKTERASWDIPDKLKKQYQNGFLTKEEFERRLIEALCSSWPDSLLSRALNKCPADVTDPRKKEAHRYHNCAQMIVEFPSGSIKGELLSAASKGGEIRIVNDLGLTAVIREASWSEKENCLIGEGWIEGYTVIGKRPFPEIKVLFDNEGHVNQLAYRESPEDAEAHRQYPLWQSYYAWAEGALRRVLEEIENRI